jgi:hypothetical protein
VQPYQAARSGCSQRSLSYFSNVAGLAAILGLTTLPGFLLTDFYDVAIYGELGGDAWQTVNDRIEELPGSVTEIAPARSALSKTSSMPFM